MKMKSHIFSATAMSCVEKITVAPWRLRSRMAFRSTSRLTGSRPVKGSSSRISSGLAMTLAMNWTFWAMPLDRVSIFFVGQSETLQPAGNGRLAVAEAFQLGIKAEQIADLHRLVQAALFG